jgi:hypothetical protein
MALSGAFVAMIDGDEAGVLFRSAAMLAVGLWNVVRVIGTVRINSATLEWDPQDPPVQWRSLIATAERFHAVGAWAATLAFICCLAAVALRLTRS